MTMTGIPHGIGVRLAWIGAFMIVDRGPVAAGPEVAARPNVRFAFEPTGDLDRCISEPSLRAAVVGRLGRDPFHAEARDRLHVTLTRDDSTSLLHAHIERDGPGGPRGARDLDAPADDCPGLLDTLSLSIAIAVDPIAFARGETERPPARAAMTASAPAISISTWGAAGVIGTLGAVPAASAGVAVQLGARRGALSLAAEVRADLPASRTIDTGRIVVSSTIGVIVGCVAPAALAGPEVCLVGGGGRLHGSGEGFTIQRAGRSWTAVIGGRLAWPVRVGPIAVVPSLALLANPIRTSFDVDGVTVWETPGLQGSVGVSARVTFF